MALNFYHDEACTQLIDESNPDYFREPVTGGATATDERAIYLKSDNPGVTYENVEITTEGDEDEASESGEIDVMYRVGGGEWSQMLVLPDGDYVGPLEIRRSITAPNVTEAFKRLDIKHQLDYDEYVK